MFKFKNYVTQKINVDNAIYLFSFFISIIIFSPIFFGFNFPLWSTDNLFGTYPFLSISSEMVKNDNSWFPYLGRGIDFSASVNNQSFSPIIKPILYLSNENIYKLMGLLTFFSFYLTPVISFYIFRHLVQNSSAALISSILIQLSLTSLFYLMIFPTIYLQFFFLLNILLIQKIKKISFILGIILLSITLMCLFLTGHPVYIFYFFLSILFFFFYELNCEKKQKEKIIIVFFISFFISFFTSLIKFYPFFSEVINGSRIDIKIIPDLFFRPLFFLKQFFPDLHGVTIDKMNEFGQFNAGIGSLNNRLGFHQGHIWVYIGILPFSFVLLSFFIGKFNVWKIISLIFVIEIVFPIFQTISNLLFYPFQKNSHLYLASFFWSISAGFFIKELIENKTRIILNKLEFFKNFIVVSLTVVLIFLFIHFFKLDNYIYKILIFFFISLLIFFKLKNVKVVFKENFYKFFTFSLLILSPLILFFITPVARFVCLNYFASIIFLFLVFQKKTSEINELFLKKNLIFFLIYLILIFISYFLLLPSLPSFSNSEDFLLIDYFRVRNIYNEISNWRIEYFLLILISILKFLLIFSNFSKVLIIKSSLKNYFIFSIIFLDLFPIFLSKTVWISKPFVKVSYDNLFVHDFSEKNNFNFRYSNVHQTLPINNLFDKRIENEILSNLPYSSKVPSYGGVNSQFSNRELEFFNSYINNKSNKSSIPNEIMDKDIGISSNFNDEILLQILGVKYIFLKDSVKELDNSLSRFTLFFSHQEAANPKEAGKLLSKKNFNFKDKIVLEESLKISNSLKKSIPLDYQMLNYDNIKVDVRANSNCILLFNDTFNSNWKAFDDKKNELSIIPANGISMAVFIPPNTKYINFLFKGKKSSFEYLRTLNQFGIYILLILFLIFLLKQITFHKNKQL